MPCPNPVGVIVNQESGQTFKLSCKRWNCEHCGKIRKYQLMDRITYGFTCEAVFHYVLTELKETTGTEEHNISKHWARLRASLAKKGITDYKFFWTKELAPLYKDRNKKGAKLYRHMHVLINRNIPKSTLEKAWYLATDKTAYIVRKTSWQLDRPAGYLAKYLTKEFFVNAFEKNERRFGCSKGFPKLAQSPKLKGTWEFLPLTNRDEDYTDMEAEDIEEKVRIMFPEGANQGNDYNFYINGIRKPEKYLGWRDVDIYRNELWEATYE